MLDQRGRRWADVVQMLYKCFVLAGRNDVALAGRAGRFVLQFTVSRSQLGFEERFCLLFY